MKRTPLKRKAKRHCNEDPESLKRERVYPYCRKCGKWVGLGGELHHELPLMLGGRPKTIYTDDQSAPFHLEKRCWECHYKRTNNLGD